MRLPDARSAILVLVALIPILAAAAAPSEEPPWGFDALLGFDALPLLADRPAFQESSYSRQDVNQDAGNFLRVEADGGQVLMDADGPGVVSRLWSTGVVGLQMSDKCRLAFFFDGEEKPRLDLSIPELFGAQGSTWPFVPPLAVTFESGQGGGEGPCNLSYVPIPFAKHLKIVGRNIMFYHVNHHRLRPGTAIESFSRDLAEKSRPVLEKAAAFWRGIPERPGVRDGLDRKEFRDMVIPPGEGRSVGVLGEGTIDEVRLKLAEPTGRNLRGAVLQIAFEDEKTVCVQAPVGDFFGSGCGDRRFQSLPCGMTEEGYYAWWPMPFRKMALVTVRNDTQAPLRLDRFGLAWRIRPQSANAGYFHARYVEDPDVPMRKDYRILQTEGRGKLVGCNVTMQNARGAQGIFFLEGDEKIYVDGEKWPSRWLGTGAEDYFNGAYFWNAPDKAVMARPLGGLTFLDWGIGRVCAYRWHFPDWVPFNREIRLDLEHGGESDWPSHYASVAYYYLEKPAAQKDLPALADRLPRTPLPPAPGNQCCEVAGAPGIDGKPLEKKSFHDLEPEFESAEGAFVGAAAPGAKVRVSVRVPGEDVFGVVLFVCGGPGFAPLKASIDGKYLGAIDTVRPAFTPWIAAEFPDLRLAAGERDLVLELQARKEGPALPQVGIVAVQLKPRSKLLDRWSIVGNWPCPKDGGWEKTYPPEENPDPGAAYKLPDGREVRWKEYEGEYVGLGGGDWVVAYGVTYIWSPDARQTAFWLGKDDGLKVWVGDAVAFDGNAWSHGTPDLFFCPVKLQAGWNRVLVRSYNWSGAWAFCLRPADPDRKLKFARKPE